MIAKKLIIVFGVVICGVVAFCAPASSLFKWILTKPGSKPQIKIENTTYGLRATFAIREDALSGQLQLHSEVRNVVFPDTTDSLIPVLATFESNGAVHAYSQPSPGQFELDLPLEAVVTGKTGPITIADLVEFLLRGGIEFSGEFRTVNAQGLEFTVCVDDLFMWN